MGEYLKGREDDCTYTNIHESLFSLSACEVPLQAEPEQSWKVVDSPRRLMKTFEFEKYQDLKDFLDQVMDYQEDVHHHAKITIDHLKIIIEVYTHDVDDVTELDQEHARTSDAIYQDVMYYNYAEGVQSEYG